MAGTCATPDCYDPTKGNSKYCKVHKAIARQNWKAKVQADAEERATRYARFETAFDSARAVASAAGKAFTPTPMTVVEPSNPLDDASPPRQTWHVPEGVCGFAWVNVSPGNSSFARWLSKNGLAGKSYYGGVDIWISAFGQSYERKMAAAEAMAEELRSSLNIKAYASGRLD